MRTILNHRLLEQYTYIHISITYWYAGCYESTDNIGRRFPYVIYPVSWLSCESIEWNRQVWTLQTVVKIGNAKAGGIHSNELTFENTIKICQIDIKVWTSVVFTKTKQRIGFPLKDRQYYITALLDVVAKILRKC